MSGGLVGPVGLRSVETDRIGAGDKNPVLFSTRPKAGAARS